MLRRLGIGLLSSVLAACGTEAPATAPDAGDGGVADPVLDASPAPEAAPVVDAAPPRADVPAVPCNDTLADAYVTPSSLPPMDLSRRGDVVRCAVDVSLTLSEVQSRIAAKGLATVATSGASLLRVAFRTTRGDGRAGVSSARVYLPKVPRALPLPVIVIAHPSEGLAGSCATSKNPSSLEDLALPWAALGYAVIAPDYAGLGNDDGVQAYLDNVDTGHSTLDAARALRKTLSPGALSPKVLVAGHSQGGGAALAAQSLASTYGAGGDLVGVVAFAPEWPTSLASFGYLNMLRHPEELTVMTGLSPSVVSVLRQYAYLANWVGLAHAADGFPVGARAAMANAVESLCLTPLGGYLQGTALHVGDLVDDAVRTSLLACVDGGTCVEPGKSYLAYLQGNVLHGDPQGAPILLVQGLLDQVMPPADEAACTLATMKADGVATQVCVDGAATHTNVVGRNMDFALGWAEKVLSGKAAPTCSAVGMPACSH